MRGLTGNQQRQAGHATQAVLPPYLPGSLAGNLMSMACPVQLRGQADDYCPNWANGEHTYDYSEGGCRQVRDPEITMNLGWAMPATGSALILHK